MGNLFYEKEKKWYVYFYVFIPLAVFLFFYKAKFKLNLDIMKKDEKTIKDQPLWDLSDLYNGINDKSLEIDLKEITDRIEHFNKKHINKIKKLTGYELYKLLAEYEKICELMGKIGSFAYLKYAENLSIEENVIFFQKISERLTNLSSKLIFVNVEINELSDNENYLNNNEEIVVQNIDIYNSIDKLNDKLKTVIILRFFENLKIEEIAVITKTNISTVKSRLYKGIEIIKKNMRGEKNNYEYTQKNDTS